MCVFCDWLHGLRSEQAHGKDITCKLYLKLFTTLAWAIIATESLLLRRQPGTQY